MKKTIKAMVLVILSAAIVSGTVADAGRAAWGGKSEPKSPTAPAR